MLGPFRVWRRGELISNESWPTQRCKSLLKILLTERGHFVSSDRLIEYLWADLPLDKAQNNLWVTVSQLRRVLEPDLERRAPSSYILKDQQGYVFNMESDTWLDVEVFLRDIATGRELDGWLRRVQALEAVKRLYQGDYLEEDPYEDWAVARREQLQAEYLGLLADLAEAYARQGRYRRAIALSREILAFENAPEAAYRNLMIYHYRAGEYNLALKVYEECRLALEDELGVEPAPETTSLYRQLQSRYVEAVDRDAIYPPPEETAFASPTLSQISFVGRAQQLGRLTSTVEQLAFKHGGIVLVEGEPGIGKSRLTQEVADYARQRGIQTLMSSCYQIEQSTPFQPVVDVVDQVVRSWPAEALGVLAPAALAEIAALTPEVATRFPGLPEPASGLDEARQARLFKALAQLFTVVAGGPGLLWVVDDIHWADHASLKFLHYLARLIHDQPILLVCTYRGEELATDEDLEAFVSGIKRDAPVTTVLLERLAQTDVQAIVDPLVASPALAQELGGWLYQETDGNPFFLVTILQSLWEQGLMGAEQLPESIERLSSPGIDLTLPEALRASVRNRLGRVSRRAHTALDAAAVLRRRFEFDTLQAITGEAPSDLMSTLEDLLARRLLRDMGDGRHYDFCHDKIREVVYYELSSTRRVYLHRQVAEALEALKSGQDEYAGTLADHFEHAQEWGKAVFYMAQAGNRSCNLFALREALNFYDRAMRLAEEHPEQVGGKLLLDLYEARGTARTQVGAFPSASADLRLALEGARRASDPEHVRRLRIYLGRVYRRSDDYENAREQLSAALDDARLSHDLHSVADTLFHLGDVLWTEGDNRLARQHQQEAVEICRSQGFEDLVAVQALHGLAETYVMNAQPREAMRYLEESLALARRIQDKAYEAENLYMLAVTQAVVAGTQYPLALEHVRESLEISRAAAMDWHILPGLFISSIVERGLGDYEKALEAATQAVQLGERLSIPYFHSIALDFQGLLYQDLNRLKEAEAAHAHGLEMAWDARAGNWLPRLQANLAIDRMRLGDLEVEPELAGALQACEARMQGLHIPLCLEGLAELCFRQGKYAATQGYADQLQELADSGDLVEIAAQAHRWRGEALLELGDLEASSRELIQALEIAGRSGMPRLLWEVHSALVRLSEKAGNNEATLEQREAAERIAAKIGLEVKSSH
jgi:predicted ATPase